MTQLRFRERSPRRAMVWARLTINQSIAAAGTGLVDLLGDLKTELGSTMQQIIHLYVFRSDIL